MAGNVVLNLLLSYFVIQQTGRKSPEKTKPICRTNNETVCYNIYGLSEEFSLTTPWSDTPIRPVRKTPFPPDQINTQFWLYAGDNQTKPYELNPGNMSTLYNSPVNTTGKLWILTHGFRSSGNTNWLRFLRSELLRLPGHNNVIVIDWATGAQMHYSQALANLRVVARQGAYLINGLQVIFGFKSKQIHLIGHSLGAHLSGLIGYNLREKFNRNVYRITGLDPANPSHSENEPITSLDKTDATFVDVIHSDHSSILGLPITVGMMAPLGHLDFYPNGGGNQPGCEDKGRKCPHVRAIYLFIDSVRQECPFIGVKCSSYEMFLQGECWGCEQEGNCAEMGYDATPPKTDISSTKNASLYYFLTNDRSPYCGHHYRISVSVSNSTEALEHHGEFGILNLTLVGTRGKTKHIRLTETTVYYQAGSVYKYVVLASDIGSLTGLKFTFHYPGMFINPMSWRFGRPRLHLENIAVETLIPETKAKFCFESEEQDSEKEYELDEYHIC